MTIPVATTSVTVFPSSTATGDVDPYEAEPVPPGPGTTPLASGVRATISVGGSGRVGTSQTIGGEDEVVEFTLVCDPVPELSYLGTVKDEYSDVLYQVVWSITTPGIAGLGHTRAGLRTVKGRA